MFGMAGDADADSEVGAAIDEELNDPGVRPIKVSQGVEDRGLAAYAVGIDVSAGVNGSEKCDY
jgi:hypothetical protein